jgi:transcriptional regulator with XRE-family HTH domain
VNAEVADGAQAPQDSVAARLDHLFRTVHPPGRGEYTLQEVVDGMAKLGHKISLTYLWKLRNGQSDNPSTNALRGLGAFFGVPPSYFIDPDVQERIDEQLQLLVAMQDAGLESIALRSRGLSSDGLQAVRDMIEHVRKLEQLPDDDISTK